MAGKIQIFLENYQGIYYSGQTVSGRVECCLPSKDNFRAVKIKYNGRAETKWTESEKYYDNFYKEERTRDVVHMDEEVYFCSEYLLIQGGDNCQYPPGKHTFPFSYILPQQLPSSFEGGYGNVRYSIKAIIDRPWRFDDESEIILNVASPLDLNYLPDLRLREPVGISVDSTPWCCWCQNSGPITFKMSLPASGFVTGQEVNIGAYIENMSNINVQSVKFQIVALFEYLVRGQGKRRYGENYITGCAEGAVGAHGNKSWTSTLTIPSDHPFPNLIPCSIINVKYLLKARVKLPCPHSDMCAKVDLMIGSVPLSGVNISLPGPPPTQSNYYYNPTAPPIDGAPSSEAIPYAPAATIWPVPTESIKGADSSAALPSYEEVQQLKGKSGNCK